MTTNLSNPRVGIIGGGQLGSLLCQAARRLGIRTVVLAPEPDCPASHHADELLVADYTDTAAAKRLAAATDCVTFEIETISKPVLLGLAREARQGVTKVFPDPAVMLCLQDKVLQKQWLVDNGLPTNPFVVLLPCGNGSGRRDTARLKRLVGLPLVQKAARGGYDGRGVQVLRSERELDDLWPVSSILEPYLAGVRELAVLVARNPQGDVAVYDPVELEFLPEANILDRVIAPARFPESLKRRAMGIAGATARRLNTAGLMAIEYFALPDDTLLINEISPRVHNSGHHTIESCRTSQFEQHLRAVLGGELGSTDLHSPAITQNLLNTPGTGPMGPFPPTRFERGSTFLHWYGKSADRCWRKLGHVTCLTRDPALARSSTEQIVGKLFDRSACA